MASYDYETKKCPICGTLVGIKISYGIYPMRSLETANCPMRGYELLHKNITGDIEAIVESLDETLEPYKSLYINVVSV